MCVGSLGVGDPLRCTDRPAFGVQGRRLPVESLQRHPSVLRGRGFDLRYSRARAGFGRGNRRCLPGWVAEAVQPVIAKALSVEGLAASIRVEGEKLFIDYETMSPGSGYVAPSVMLEFGARSTGEPASLRDVVCEAAGLIDGVTFPAAQPRVMDAERTFWEKATAIHVFCLQGRLRGDRFARHWHDVARLDDAGFAEAAFLDRELAQAAASHKSMFFAERTAERTFIDYVSGCERRIAADSCR